MRMWLQRERRESARAAKSENGHTEQLCCTFTGCGSEAVGRERVGAERSADPSDKAAWGYLAGAMAVRDVVITEPENTKITKKLPTI